MLRRLCAKFLDWTDHVWTLARLTVLDWPAGPPPETPTDRAIREEGEGEAAMISDLDIWRAATLLIRKHGADAELEAAKRADLMLERGDRDGELVLFRIRRAIVELQAAPVGKPH
jgi:hypothetical protein